MLGNDSQLSKKEEEGGSILDNSAITDLSWLVCSQSNHLYSLSCCFLWFIYIYIYIYIYAFSKLKLKACRSYCSVTLSVSAKINSNIIWGLDHPFQRSQSQPTTCFMRACQLRPWSVTPYLTPAPSAALPPACEDTYFNDPKQSKALARKSSRPR
jgi:hypothetical protein